MGIIQGLVTTECNIVREHTCVNASLNMNIPSKKPRQSLIGLNCFSSPSSNRQPFHSVGTWEAPAILGAQTLWRWYSSSALQSGSSVVSWLRNKRAVMIQWQLFPSVRRRCWGPQLCLLGIQGKCREVESQLVPEDGVAAEDSEAGWGGGEVKCGGPG